MSAFSHCRECGRRLSDVLFCPRCGQWLCCSACLAQDAARHSLLRGSSRNSTATRRFERLAPRRVESSSSTANQGTDVAVLYNAGELRAAEIRARQNRFQVVQLHWLDEVSVEAGILRKMPVFFLTVSRHRHERHVVEAEILAKMACYLANRSCPAW